MIRTSFSFILLFLFLIGFQSYFTEKANIIKNTGIGIIGKSPQWMPLSIIKKGMAAYNDPWFEPVEFMGAFGNIDWTEGWTLISNRETLE